VSLSAYVFKALHDTGVMRMEAGTATAIAVPVALIGIALIVRRIRRHTID
jgi:uncharacterized membrane-anchored protein